MEDDYSPVGLEAEEEEDFEEKDPGSLKRSRSATVQVACEPCRKKVCTPRFLVFYAALPTLTRRLRRWQDAVFTPFG